MKLHFKKTLKKRIAVGCLIAVMCLSTVLSSATKVRGGETPSSQTQRSVAFKNVTGEVDLSNVKLDNLSEYVMANVDTSKHETRAVIITLKGKSLVESAGKTGVSEYVTSASGQAQKKRIDQEHTALLSDLNARGVEYEFITEYNAALNGVAIKVNTAYIPLIKLLPNVDKVAVSETYSVPKTVTEGGNSASDITNKTSVYQTGIYDSSKYAEEYGGKGMVVAILDTGLDYTHEAFQTQPDLSYTRFKESDITTLTGQKDFSAKGDLFVSDKIPFAYDYADRDADVYPSYSNHGTHVAGIIGGSASSYTDKDGLTPTDEKGDPIPFKSVAPNAQLVICKVFTDNLDSKNVGGAETQDILDALDDCVKLGVDVINMSLGTTCGFSTTNDGDLEGELLHETYQSIQEAGISLICAASNDYSSAYGGTFGTNLTSNPDSGTVGSPSTFASALSVASISGKKSPFVLANADGDNSKAVFYNESSDENNVDYDFAELMLEGKESATFKYVVIKGTYYGSAADYNTSYVKKAISNTHDNGEKIIALVKRGGNLTFQEKVENAMAAKADAIIVYNNVAGEIKMTIGDVDDPIPAISVSYEAGQAMVDGARSNLGTVTLNPTEYQAGPFMSNFSSWGVTPDLKLKPEITAHGGEITSSVPGGWDEQSGTSMATPNVAGLVANVRSYVSVNWNKFFDEKPTAVQITALTNQLMMSTATVVVDQEALPYSPRKQGAGLASLENIIDKTSAYLYTLENEAIQSAHGSYFGANDNRPKLELGEDEEKVGEYTLQFYYNNRSANAMAFELNSLFMTESVSLDGLAVGEQAYMLGGNAKWKIEGIDGVKKDGDVVSLKSGIIKITVTLSLSGAEKEYLDKNFKNGMYVEGFIRLLSQDANQCDLSLPFLGFYGDWDSAPMLDYDAFEISEIEQDDSILEEEKPKASVWATQAYAIYWNDKYVLPMGSFVYKQNEDDDEVRKIYTTEEYTSVSCYNEYNGADSNNYMTSTGIKGIYAGLLRNAKQVDCRMYNVATGELIYSKEVYRVNKAYSNGGSTTPGFVKLELTPSELGLVENGKYYMEFDFHYKTPDENTVVDPENTFNFSFYVDYTAPVLEDARIRYYDYKSGNKDMQKVYLDLDVFDNHYSMAALLCYLDSTDATNPELQLCTEYVTPIYDPKKNGTTTVSIEITDIIEKYGDNLYVELDDYALNHSVYQINLSDAQKSPLPNSFELAEGEENITIGKYEKHKVSLVWNKELYPNANLSNFTWTVTGKSTDIVAVKNGEIVGLSAGEGKVTVSNGRTTKEIKVTVTDNDKTLNYSSISFDVILNDVKAPVKAQGVVDVDISQDIKLEIMADPWYYPVENLKIVWQSKNPSVATVDQDGNVTLLKKGRASILATIKGTAYSATVMLNVQEPFKVSNYSLTGYEGAGGVVYIPTDMNIMTIGEEAFKGNTDITAVVIPKTVTTIDARAFYGCTNLKQVFFVDVGTPSEDKSNLTLINWEAFYGCTSLEYLDFSNCKTFTVARQAFYGCENLKLIKGIEHVGTAYDQAFANCTSLIGSLSSDSGVVLVNSEATKWDEKENVITDIEVIPFEDLKDKNGNDLKITELDISSLHVSASHVFAGCESIINIKMGKFTALGRAMFSNCKSLKNITLDEVGSIGAYAFEKCFGLEKVTFNVQNCDIGEGAFSNSGNLIEVDFGSSTISSIESYAFENTSLNEFSIPFGLTKLGENILVGTAVNEVRFDLETLKNIEFIGNPFVGISLLVGDETTASEIIYGVDEKGTLSVLHVNSSAETLVIDSSVQKIGDYAFANLNIENIVIPASVKVIGDGAFKNSSLKTIVFESGSTLESIEKEAFYGTKIESVTLSNSVTLISDRAFANSNISQFIFESENEIAFGNGVFENCQRLVEIDLSKANITSIGSYTFGNAISLLNVKMPAVKELGEFTFWGATNVSSVVFDENATTTGEYTFFTYSMSGAVTPYEKLTSVVLGGGIEKIGAYAFVYCTELETVDIRNATAIGDMAFYGCASLKTVKGLNSVKSIGAYAFWNCKELRSLSLDSVEHIAEGAFRVEREEDEKALTVSIEMPNVQTIGAYAFYGTGALQISLPASISEIQEKDVYNIDGAVYGNRNVSPIGIGAFANSPNLEKITVDKENTTYFDDNGVLYRYLPDGAYELVSFPSAFKATDYLVKEGTARIESYSFAGAKNLTGVTVAYSVVSIGAGAFFDSAVDSYIFDCHIAPTLESEFNELLKEYLRLDISFRGMFNNNFVDYVIEYADEVSSISQGNVSILELTYPINGIGYDSYVYRKYFTSRTQNTYALTSEAKIFKNNIESFSIEIVNAWLEDSFAVNETNKATVLETAEFIRQNHQRYNNVANDENQCILITEATVNKLFEIEKTLRLVKEKFGIESKATSYTFSGNYKKEYVEGETFDPTDLTVTVIYDDYSTQDFTGDDIVVLEESQAPLTVIDSVVYVTCDGRRYGVRIRVSEKVEVQEPDSSSSDSSSSSDLSGDEDGNAFVVVISVIGGLAVLSAAAFILLKKKGVIGVKKQISIEENSQNNLTEDEEKNGED